MDGTVKEYVSVLITGLEKKIEYLNLILSKTERQKELLKQEDFPEEEFHNLAEEKSTLIQGLDDNDDGFTLIYERIGNTLQEQKSLYQREIERMQALIREISDKSVKISALETQNRAALELYFGKERKKIRQVKKSQQAAAGYYSAVSKLNVVDPQFMDKKK